jgi:hypothetical protein
VCNNNAGGQDVYMNRYGVDLKFCSRMSDSLTLALKAVKKHQLTLAYVTGGLSLSFPLAMLFNRLQS